MSTNDDRGPISIKANILYICLRVSIESECIAHPLVGDERSEVHAQPGSYQKDMTVFRRT